jgi:hypothetical protein
MTRISSLLVAASLAILPIGAFAQPTAAPAKTAAPASMTTAPVTAPVSDKAVTGQTATADVTKPAKPEAKTPAAGAKSEVHGMNTVKTHHTKTAEPAKS